MNPNAVQKQPLGYMGGEEVEFLIMVFSLEKNKK